jgi:hypothetical protein
MKFFDSDCSCVFRWLAVWEKRSPFAHTFVAELANENIGYIPDRRSYAEGNYEPESARWAAGSGEKLVDTAAGMLAELFKDAGRIGAGRQDTSQDERPRFSAIRRGLARLGRGRSRLAR